MKTKGLAQLFKALGDPNRMAIFRHICKCSEKGDASANVNEVSRVCDVDLSVVSRHLSTLNKAGVLSKEKIGKEVHYRVEGKQLAESLRKLADYVEGSCCPPAPNRKGEKNVRKSK